MPREKYPERNMTRGGTGQNEARVDSFAALKQGWDSYGASPVTPEAIEKAKTLVRIWGEREPQPSIAPLCDGGISFDWDEDGHWLILDIPATGGEATVDFGIASPEGAQGQERSGE